MPKKFEGLVEKGDFDPLLEDLKDTGRREPKPKKRPAAPQPAPRPEEKVVAFTPPAKAKPPKRAPEKPSPSSKPTPEPEQGGRLPTRSAQFEKGFNRDLTACLQRIGQRVGLTSGLPYNVSARIACTAFQHAENEIIEELERSGELEKLGTRPANKDAEALAEWEDLWTKTVFKAWQRMRPWT